MNRFGLPGLAAHGVLFMEVGNHLPGDHQRYAGGQHQQENCADEKDEAIARSGGALLPLGGQLKLEQLDELFWRRARQSVLVRDSR